MYQQLKIVKNLIKALRLFVLFVITTNIVSKCVDFYQKTHPDMMKSLKSFVPGCFAPCFVFCLRLFTVLKKASQTVPMDYTVTACLTCFSMIMGTSLLPITDVAIITVKKAPSGAITRIMTILIRDFSLPSVIFPSSVKMFRNVQLSQHRIHS